MKTIQVIFLSLCFYNCTSQITYMELCRELYQYTEVSEGKIKTFKNKENYTELFKIKELVSKDTVLLKQNGIYQYDSYTEDASKGIFIKRNNFFEIYRISSPGFFLPKVMTFLNDSSAAFSDSIKLLYINSIIEIYKEEFEYKTNVVIEKQNGQFKYYF